MGEAKQRKARLDVAYGRENTATAKRMVERDIDRADRRFRALGLTQEVVGPKEIATAGSNDRVLVKFIVGARHELTEEAAVLAQYRVLKVGGNPTFSGKGRTAVQNCSPEPTGYRAWLVVWLLLHTSK
jgi:hypothetical protein